MVGKDLAVVSIFKPSPFPPGRNGDGFEVAELPDDCQEYDDMEGSGKDKVLSIEGSFAAGECSRVSSLRFEAEVALRRGDFAGVGGLTFSIFSEVGVRILGLNFDSKFDGLADMLEPGDCFNGVSDNLGEGTRLISGNKSFSPTDTAFRGVSPVVATSDSSAFVGALRFGPRALAFVICHNDQRVIKEKQGGQPRSTIPNNLRE